jgi:hypothetical protein
MHTERRDSGIPDENTASLLVVQTIVGMLYYISWAILVGIGSSLHFLGELYRHNI